MLSIQDVRKLEKLQFLMLNGPFKKRLILRDLGLLDVGLILGWLILIKILFVVILEKR